MGPNCMQQRPTPRRSMRKEHRHYFSDTWVKQVLHQKQHPSVTKYHKDSFQFRVYHSLCEAMGSPHQKKMDIRHLVHEKMLCSRLEEQRQTQKMTMQIPHVSLEVFCQEVLISICMPELIQRLRTCSGSFSTCSYYYRVVDLKSLGTTSEHESSWECSF